MYILENKTLDKYYVGFSENLKNRIRNHEQHTVKTTKSEKYDLAWYSAFKNKATALKFEKYLKSGSGFAFRNKHLL